MRVRLSEAHHNEKIILGLLIFLSVINLHALSLTEVSNEIVNARFPFSSLKLKLDSITFALAETLAESASFIDKISTDLAGNPTFVADVASAAF